ncbi:MAG: YggS family pyridoxal phosphate-dependent enzyme, partial [Pseudomonadota bacterium]|nr:YggS family pyridoxal phosphate-dependent enzyme [Pseudomonadota bacterium]
MIAMTDLTQTLAGISARITEAARAAGRDPQDIELMAVSKGHSVAAIEALLVAGHRLFGESRVQEAREKWPALKARYPDVQLHLIGPLQTNKVRAALNLFDCIETVDRPKLAQRLAEVMAETGRRVPCWIDVNIGGEPQKKGIAPKDAPSLLALMRELALNVQGLMTIPPKDDNPGRWFAALADLAHNMNLENLSMGMSADFETAISHGATCVRIGTALFATEHWNLPAAKLIEMAVRRGEGRLAEGGVLVVETGEHTGRSPNDRYIVLNDASRDDVWWEGKPNAPVSLEQAEALKTHLMRHLQGKETFIADVWAGADPAYRIPVRIVSESSVAALFAGNMFIHPTDSELAVFKPELALIHAPSCLADPAIHGTRTGAFVSLDFEGGEILIGGTSYAGEIKKAVFTTFNFLLPSRGVLPMHCSATTDETGGTAVFFGLSGTGKTTLSADAERILIGDDEHGWTDDGVFNFEGGCYAKTIRLSKKAEP